ncbi:MAG: AAA family ATPase, partial [Sciscionella sp.]
MPRERLLRAVRTTTARLLLVTAPPGSGKTTLLGHVAAGGDRTAGRSAWVQADAADVGAPALLTSIATAVGHATGVEAPVNPSENELLILLEGCGGALTVIIDDAHLLAGTEAERALASLVALLPARIRVLLAGRSELTVVSGPARLAGAVFDLATDELRFRAWEVEQLFRDHYGAALPPEDAAALTRYTEGWAAGLAMFQLATGARPLAERQRAVAGLWGRSRLLRGYLTANVLATLSAEVAEFMVRSSVLGLLEGSLCDRLLHRSGSDAVLRDLAERQMFTSCCDEAGWYYRYHIVLQTQLESMLVERLGAEGASALYARAAALLEEAEHWPEAYRAFAHAEDWVGGGRVLQRWGAVGEVPDSGTASDLGDHDPWLALAEARRLRSAGRLVEACQNYAKAESRFDDPRMKRRARDEHRLLLPWTTHQAPAGPPTGESWSADLRRAMRAEPGRLTTMAAGRTEPHWRLAVGLAAMVDDHPQESYQALEDAAERGAGFVALAARLSRVIVLSMLRVGTPGGEADELDSLILEARLAGQSWLARIAGAAREIVDGSLPAASEVLAECDREGDHWGALEITLLRGVALLRGGGDAEAELSEFAARARKLDMGVQQRWAEGLLVSRARLGAMDEWVDVRGGRFELRCFGRFSLAVDGRELNWRSLRPRAQAMLRLLCLHAGQPVHEELL